MWRAGVQRVTKSGAAGVFVRQIAAAAYTSGRSYANLASQTAGTGFSSKAAAAVLTTAAAAATFACPIALAATRERSFIMIKPDGVNRGLTADIIKRYEAKGYKLVGIKVVVPTKDLAAEHYEEHNGRPFFPKLVDFLSSGAVIAMVWEGKEVIKYGRTMIGATNPLASAPGTIRGDYGVDVGRNIIHGSDSVDSAQREIALWFKPSELADYELSLESWIYE